MKDKKRSPEQIIKKLREAETMIATGKTIGQVVQALEISEQTFTHVTTGTDTARYLITYTWYGLPHDVYLVTHAWYGCNSVR